MATASPLPSQLLEQTFPDAPGDHDVPESLWALYRVRLRQFAEQHRVWVIAWTVLLVGGALALWIVVNVVVAGVMAVILVAVAVGVLIHQHSKARHAFWDSYASARGLEHAKGGHMSANVPLFGKGDKRDWAHLLTGRVGGHEATLAMYTYTEITHNSKGERQESDSSWTVLHFRLPPDVAARYRGVSLTQPQLTLGKLQDKMSHDRAVRLESSDFHKRYSLRVVDEQDDIALFELFNSTFIDQLTSQFQAFWEQRGDDLVIFQKGHESETYDLDTFCLDGSRVLQRYLEEWQ